MFIFYFFSLWVLSYSPMISDEISQSQLKIAVRNTVKATVPLFYSDGTFRNAVLQLDNNGMFLSQLLPMPVLLFSKIVISVN